MKYPELASAMSEAIGDKSPEQFAGEVGCGMSTLRRWMAGTHAPRSTSHKRALQRRGVPANVLPRHNENATVLNANRPTGDSDEAAA